MSPVPCVMFIIIMNVYMNVYLFNLDDDDNEKTFIIVKGQTMTFICCKAQILHITRAGTI